MSKKTIALLFIFVCFSFFPYSKPAKAVVYQLTVTVSSLKIPERAAMLSGANYDPNSEFCLTAGPNLAIKNGSTIRRQVALTKGATINGNNVSSTCLGAGAAATITWPYQSGDEAWFILTSASSVTGSSTTYMCNTDCSPINIPSGSTGYYSDYWYWTGSAWTYSYCPNPPCQKPGGAAPNSNYFYTGMTAQPGFDLGTP